jgi:transcription elongation factor Elf1
MSQIFVAKKKEKKMRLDRFCGECGNEFSVIMTMEEIDSGAVSEVECSICGERDTFPTIIGPHKEPSVWNSLE